MSKYEADKSAWRTNPVSRETPWGKEKQWSALPGINGKIIKIKKGHRTSLKFHPRKDEAFYILAGKIKFEYGNEDWLKYKGADLKEEILSTGDSMCVQSNCAYRMHALETSEVIEIGSYGTEDEVVRIEDDYGRKVSNKTFPNTWNKEG